MKLLFCALNKKVPFLAFYALMLKRIYHPAIPTVSDNKKAPKEKMIRNYIVCPCTVHVIEISHTDKKHFIGFDIRRIS